MYIVGALSSNGSIIKLNPREGEEGGMRRRRGLAPYTTRGAVAVQKILVRTYQSVVVVQKICCMPTDGHSWPLYK